MTLSPYVLMIYDEGAARQATYLIRSLLDLGNMPVDQPVWAFSENPSAVQASLGEYSNIEWHTLNTPEDTPPYYFKAKTLACAQAEELAQQRGIPSLTWLANTILFFSPPERFSLAEGVNAALRPVHHKNIGAIAGQPLDAFWARLYAEMGVPAPVHTVQSYADVTPLYPYFNSHLFAIRTEFGILQRWRDVFIRLIRDEEFQSSVCGDVAHKIFLHQAIFSTLLDQYLPWESIALLPPSYSYPLDLHEEIHADDQVTELNQIVCAVYETPLPSKSIFHNIPVQEPIASWIMKHCPET